jgi:hypothetical protein
MPLREQLHSGSHATTFLARRTSTFNTRIPLRKARRVLSHSPPLLRRARDVEERDPAISKVFAEEGVVAVVAVVEAQDGADVVSAQQERFV